MVSYGLARVVIATANKIRDGGARYVATSFSISADRSLMTAGRTEVWAETLLRLQLGSCPSGEDAIVAVVAGALLRASSFIHGHGVLCEVAKFLVSFDALNSMSHRTIEDLF